MSEDAPKIYNAKQIKQALLYALGWKSGTLEEVCAILRAARLVHFEFETKLLPYRKEFVPAPADKFQEELERTLNDIRSLSGAAQNLYDTICAGDKKHLSMDYAPEGFMREICKACGSPILFIQTENRRLNPCNPEPVQPDGEKILVFFDGSTGKTCRTNPEAEGYISHFATCPKGREFRKGNR